MIHCEVVDKIQTMLKISNSVTDEERHYLQNLVISGMGEVPDEDGKVSSEATHVFIIELGFITGAMKIERRKISDLQNRKQN